MGNYTKQRKLPSRKPKAISAPKSPEYSESITPSYRDGIDEIVPVLTKGEIAGSPIYAVTISSFSPDATKVKREIVISSRSGKDYDELLQKIAKALRTGKEVSTGGYTFWLEVYPVVNPGQSGSAHFNWDPSGNKIQCKKVLKRKDAQNNVVEYVVDERYLPYRDVI